MRTTEVKRAVRSDFLARVEVAKKANPKSEWPQIGLDLAAAGIGPAFVAVTLPCDERSVRRWFLVEAVPRKGDATRVRRLHKCAALALEKGLLPCHGSIEEIMAILKGTAS